MHKFLRAIGFSHITKEQLQHIFADIISAPTVQKAALDSEGNEFAELSKEYGDFFGISVRGVYNEDDTFEMEYYYPYLCGKNISTIEPAEVEKHAEKESYAGICDEVRIGVTLIFYLQNVVDYLAVSKSKGYMLSLIHISEPTRLGMISYAVFCLKKKKKKTRQTEISYAVFLEKQRKKVA